MAGSPDVIVVGGGIVGCATAYYLARRGVAVTLLERERIAADASSVAAGTLGPLSHVAGPGPHLDFCRAALQLYPALAAELLESSGADIEYTPVGKLRVALSVEQAAALQADIPWHVAAGFGSSWLTGEEVHRLEPALGPDILGALLSPQEHHVCTPRVAEAFAKGAARFGADIRIGAEVVGLTTAGSRVTGVRFGQGETLAAGAVVLAGGAWTGMWDWLGRRLPITPVGGMTVMLSTAEPPPFTYSISGGESLLVARRGGTVIAGVTVEREGYDKRITAAGVAQVLNGVTRLVPAVGAAQF
ncbi:MAG: FAD-dependent oxidoreductase, partial [Chloroflexi bacterium]|nr:FAD-dependent oxidoreductase [Chloroflexota bacterium]